MRIVWSFSKRLVPESRYPDFGDPAENYFRSRVFPEDFIDSKEVLGNVVRYFASFGEAIRDFTVEETGLAALNDGLNQE